MTVIKTIKTLILTFFGFIDKFSFFFFRTTKTFHVLLPFSFQDCVIIPNSGMCAKKLNSDHKLFLFISYSEFILVNSRPHSVAHLYFNAQALKYKLHTLRSVFCNSFYGTCRRLIGW